MRSILEYQYVTPLLVAQEMASSKIHMTHLWNWLIYGKIAENPIVSATAETQVVTPTSINRYLQSVTILPKA